LRDLLPLFPRLKALTLGEFSPSRMNRDDDLMVVRNSLAHWEGQIAGAFLRLGCR
jgi:hypothetical protein